MSNEEALKAEEDQDEDIQLPADTLAILQEFMKEQQEKDLEEDWVSSKPVLCVRPHS